MDTPDNQDMPALEPAEGSPSDYQSLAQFVISVLILVIVVSGTLNILLLRLWKTSSTDADALRPQYRAIKEAYERNDAGPIDRLTKTLQAYGATNPDYVPTLTRYGFKPVPAEGAFPTPPKK